MKKLLLVFLFIPLISFSQYSNGYRDGWKKGYCFEKGYSCVAPYPPMAPTPNLTKGEDFNYKSGYSRGLLDGRAASSGGNSSRSKGVDWSKAYEYAPGGAKSQQMTNDAIDRALNERRSYNRGSSSNYNYSSGSTSNAPSINYSLYNIGMKKYNAYDYEGAIRDFTAHIQKYPNNDEGWLIRGLAKLRLKIWSGACYDFKRGADLGNEDAQKYLIEYCNSDGTPQKYASDWYNEGRKKAQNGDYQGAIYAFTTAIELLTSVTNINENDVAIVYNDRAASKRESGDPTGAIVDYNKGIALDPNYTTLWGGRGTAKSYLKDMVGACMDWKTATITGENEVAKKFYQEKIDEYCNNGYLKTGNYTLYSDASSSSEVLHKIKGEVRYRVIKKGWSYTLIETDNGERGYILTYDLGN